MSRLAEGRVALDLTITQHDRAGSGVYAANLASALEPLLGSRLAPVRFRGTASRSERRGWRGVPGTLARDLWWTQHAVVQAARRTGATLLHLPAGVGPARPALPLVVTIHDLAVLRFPAYFRPWQGAYARWVVPRVARGAAAIIAVSRSTKADLVNLLNVSEDRITVVPNGVGCLAPAAASDNDSHLDIRQRYRLPEAFVLTVGSIEPRKNLSRLLRAVHQLRQRPETRDLTLVHAGPPGWLSGDVTSTLKELKLGDGVRFLGYLPSDHLAALYRLARALAYPSLFEGFGLPVLEAMAAGCPVVTSNTAALPEIAEDAAFLVDPLSVEGIADAVGRVWTDEQLAAGLRERGRARARQYSWERTARETVGVYQRVLGSGLLA